jgi:hypothetical protein
VETVDNYLIPFIYLKTTSLKLVYTPVYKPVNKQPPCEALGGRTLVISSKSTDIGSFPQVIHGTFAWPYLGSLWPGYTQPVAPS